MWFGCPGWDRAPVRHFQFRVSVNQGTVMEAGSPGWLLPAGLPAMMRISMDWPDGSPVRVASLSSGSAASVQSGAAGSLDWTL